MKKIALFIALVFVLCCATAGFSADQFISNSEDIEKFDNSPGQIKNIEKVLGRAIQFYDSWGKDFKVTKPKSAEKVDDLIFGALYMNFIDNFGRLEKETRKTEDGIEQTIYFIDKDDVDDALCSTYGFTVPTHPKINNENERCYKFDGKKYHFRECADGSVEDVRVNYARLLENGLLKVQGSGAFSAGDYSPFEFTAILKRVKCGNYYTWAVREVTFQDFKIEDAEKEELKNY